MKFRYNEVHLDTPNESIAKTIERRARICYKSEDKITEDSARPFVEKMVKHKHMTVLEMASQTIIVKSSQTPDTLVKTGFLDYLKKDRGSIIVSGTCRALYELMLNNPGHNVAHAINYFFKEYLYQLYIESIDTKKPIAMIDPETVSTEAITIIDAHHSIRRLTFRIVTNRAVSHELVRHRPINVLQESQRYVRYDDMEFIYPEPFISSDAVEILNDTDEAARAKAIFDFLRSAESIYRDLLNKGMAPQAARVVLPNATKTELLISATVVQWGHILHLRDSKAADPSMQIVARLIRERINEELGSIGIERRIG